MAEQNAINLVVTNDALADVKALALALESVDTKLKSIINTSKSGGSNGSLSGYKNAIQEQTEYQNSLKKTSNEVEKLTVEKQKAQKLTAQEKVDNAIINKQEREEAILTSKLADAYQKINVQRTRAKENLRKLVVEQGLHTAEVKKAQKEFDILDKKVRQADKAVGDMSKNVGNYKSAFSGLSNLMGAFGIGTGLYLFADIAQNIFKTTKELQSLDLALKNVSGSQEAFASSQAFLSGISQSYGIEIKGLTKNYTDFLAASKGLLSQEKIEQVFTSVSKSAAAMGLSVESTDSAFLALEQMMSKGTIQAEELKKQLGNALPGAMRAAAMAYMELHPEITKVADAERIVMQEMKKGAIDSATYIPLIVKQFEKLYGIENVTNINTLQSAVNRLSNSWVNLIRTMSEDKSSVVTQTFTGSIIIVESLLNKVNTLISSIDRLRSGAKGKGGILGASDFKAEFETESTVLKSNTEKIELAVKKGNSVISEIKKAREKVEYERLRYNSSQGLSDKDLLNAERNLGYLIAYKKEAQKKANEIYLLSKESENVKQPKETESQKNKRLKEEEKARKAQEKANDDAEKKAEELRKNKYQRELSDLERSKEIIKDVRDAKETSLQEILFLEDAYSFKELEILKKQYEEEQRIAGSSEDLQQIATNKFLTERENLIADHLKRIEDIRTKDANKTEEYYKEHPPLFMLSRMDTKKELSQEEKDAISARIKAFNEYVGDFAEKSGFGQSFDFLAKKGKNDKSLFENLIKGEGDWKDYFTGISSLAQDTMNLIDSFSQERFDRERSRLEEQYKLASEFASGNADAQKKLDEDYAKRKRQIQEKEFKHKQKMTMINIAMDTAQAVVRTLAEGAGFFSSPLAIAVAALGAIQIGMVATQKMPAYAEGTENHKGGLALVNDGKGANYGETIIMPNGKVIQPKGRNVVMDLPKGTSVKTHEQWNNQLSLMEQEGLKYSNINVNNGITEQAMDRILEKHIANQTNVTNGFSGGELYQFVNKRGNITKQVAQRGQGIGLKFN